MSEALFETIQDLFNLDIETIASEYQALIFKDDNKLFRLTDYQFKAMVWNIAKDQTRNVYNPNTFEIDVMLSENKQTLSQFIIRHLEYNLVKFVETLLKQGYIFTFEI